MAYHEERRAEEVTGALGGTYPSIEHMLGSGPVAASLTVEVGPDELDRQLALRAAFWEEQLSSAEHDLAAMYCRPYGYYYPEKRERQA